MAEIIDVVDLETARGRYQYELTAGVFRIPHQSKYAHFRLPNRNDNTRARFNYTLNAALNWNITDVEVNAWSAILESLFVDGGQHLLYSLEEHVHNEGYRVGRFKFTLKFHLVDNDQARVISGESMSLTDLKLGGFPLMQSTYDNEVVPMLRAIFRGENNALDQLKMVEAYAASGSETAGLLYDRDFIIDKNKGSIFIYMMLNNEPTARLLNDVNVTTNSHMLNSDFLEENFPVDSTGLIFSIEKFREYRTKLRRLLAGVGTSLWREHWIQRLENIFTDHDRGLMDEFLQELREYA